MSIGEFVKLLVTSSPVIIMGIVIACILYFSLPIAYLIYIGILEPKYKYSEIVGHLFLLGVGLLIGYGLKCLWQKSKHIPSFLRCLCDFRFLKKQSAINLLNQIAGFPPIIWKNEAESRIIILPR